MEIKCTYHWWLLSFFINLLTACSGGGEELDEPAPPPSQPTITLQTSASDFPAEGGSNTVSFTASVAWTASVVDSRTDSWCSVSPASGPAGNADIIITTMANDTPDDRSISVVIKAGSAQKTVMVSQKQKDALTVTSNKFFVSVDGGEVKIEVKANIDFTYTIDESAKNWITAVGSRALKTSTLVFNVAPNEASEIREGTLTISNGDLQETVTVYQFGTQPVIILTKNEYEVPSDGGQLQLEVEHNVEFDVSIDVDWITQIVSRSFGSSTLTFNVAENTESNDREGTITFTSKNGTVTQKVKVLQLKYKVFDPSLDNWEDDEEHSGSAE